MRKIVALTTGVFISLIFCSCGLSRTSQAYIGPVRPDDQVAWLVGDIVVLSQKNEGSIKISSVDGQCKFGNQLINTYKLSVLPGVRTITLVSRSPYESVGLGHSIYTSLILTSNWRTNLEAGKTYTLRRVKNLGTYPPSGLLEIERYPSGNSASSEMTTYTEPVEIIQIDWDTTTNPGTNFLDSFLNEVARD